VQHRLRQVRRKVGDDLARLRIDAAATKAAVASAAGIDRTFYGRIEAGEATPGLETLLAVATALGADVSIRLHGGTGPRLADRYQAPMIEAVVRRLHETWRPHLEVPVWRPSRGVVDLALERVDVPTLVVGESISILARLEQQLRWSAEKADSIGSSSIVGDGPVPPVSRLLILRSTEGNRALARQFEATLSAAYPATTADAVRSLTEGAPWPGAAVIWVRVEGGEAVLLDDPPRGVSLGRSRR
jgi:transcriptional regulator with XRE-family HTH domain